MERVTKWMLPVGQDIVEDTTQGEDIYGCSLGERDINIYIYNIEESVTQRRNSILAILRKYGLCVTEHLGCFTSH